MAFYNVKLKESAAVEGAVQGPEIKEIGNDLEQIEKTIAGPDGIEAHMDEIEYAAGEADDGTDDPIAESYQIMYEAEYNFNQIMQCIGLSEINEAFMNRELVLEGASIKGFFDKVRAFLKKMFERVTKIVKDVLKKLDVQGKVDKAFATKYEKAIIDGAENGKWGTFNGYDYDEKAVGLVDAIKKGEDKSRAVVDTLEAEFDKLKDDMTDAEADEKLAKTNKEDKAAVLADVINAYSGTDAKNIADMVAELVKKYKGDKVEIDAEKASAADKKKLASNAIALLKDEAETKAIRAAYAAVKESFAKDLKAVNDLEKAVEKGDKFKTIKLRYASGAVSVLKMHKNVMNSVYGTMMKIARAKRNQARALAFRFYNHSSLKKEKTPEVQHNSAGLFSGINLI